MTRVAATLCLALTLFCPVVCLTGTGDSCPDRGPSEVRNCEAISIGALIAKSVIDTTPLCLQIPSLDRLAPTVFVAAIFRDRSKLAARNRENSKPPPASTRHALLQTFLF